MSFPPVITSTPVFHQDELNGDAFSTADLDTQVILLRDTLNQVITRLPLSTNADGTPLTSTVSTAVEADVLAALAATGGAALIGTAQPGATVEAAIAATNGNVTALTAGVGTAADIIRRTGSVPFTANQSMGSHKLTDVADGVATGDAVNYGQLASLASQVITSARALRRDGTNSMTADLPFGGYKGVNAANGTAATDLTNKQQVDAMLAILSPVGSLLGAAFSTPPTGYLLCDGTAVSRTTYAALYTAIGVTYGVGDGATTFNLPDARGRAALGVGTGSGLTARALGASGGEETHLLTEAEMPAHVHQMSPNTTTGSVNLSGTLLDTGAGAAKDTGSKGGSTAHNNMQPYWVNATFIRYQLATV